MFIIVLLHILNQGSDGLLSLGSALGSLGFGLGRVLDSLVSFGGSSLVLGALNLNRCLCFSSSGFSLCSSLLGFSLGDSFLTTGTLGLLLDLSCSNLSILLLLLGGGLCLNLGFL